MHKTPEQETREAAERARKSNDPMLQALADLLDEVSRYAALYSKITLATTGNAPAEHDSFTRKAVTLARQIPDSPAEGTRCPDCEQSKIIDRVAKYIAPRLLRTTEQNAGQMQIDEAHEEGEHAFCPDDCAAVDKPVDTLPQWLHSRFVINPRRIPWSETSEADQSYWRHQANAVRRAVDRNGFRAEG